jgi:hypothetical protein
MRAIQPLIGLLSNLDMADLSNAYANKPKDIRPKNAYIRAEGSVSCQAYIMNDHIQIMYVSSSKAIIITI